MNKYVIVSVIWESGTPRSSNKVIKHFSVTSLDVKNFERLRIGTTHDFTYLTTEEIHKVILKNPLLMQL